MSELFAGVPPAAHRRRARGVAELVRDVAEALANRFNAVTVEGEISAYARAASGHCYFNLKDADGSTTTVRCAMFRRAASLLAFAPVDGQLVEVRGRLGVYEPRGELQLVVESLQRSGAGALYEQFLRTRARLDAEGLFDASRKRALPPHPRSIGLVASLGSAVLHDVATTLARRAPHVAVVVYPSVVQGAGAPVALCAAIELASRRCEVDVLIVCRGGGSIEDLWAFNDENLVRAIVASRVPVVTGVGHETDLTLADLAADLRAPTPTAAAELAAPLTAECLQTLAILESRLARQLRIRVDSAGQRLDRVCDRMIRPGLGLRLQTQALDLLSRRLESALARAAPWHRAALDRRDVDLARSLVAQARREGRRLALAEARLRTLDPRQVLSRGYAWLADADEQPVMSVDDLAIGQRLSAILTDGTASVMVDDLRPAPRP